MLWCISHFYSLQFEEILKEDCYILMGFLWGGGVYRFKFVVFCCWWGFFVFFIFYIFAIVALYLVLLWRKEYNSIRLKYCLPTAINTLKLLTLLSIRIITMYIRNIVGHTSKAIIIERFDRLPTCII